MPHGHLAAELERLDHGVLGHLGAGAAGRGQRDVRERAVEDRQALANHFQVVIYVARVRQQCSNSLCVVQINMDSAK